MKMDNKEMVSKIINAINQYKTEELRIMEVCGTHTQAISQTGIRSMLPSNITLTSGPGCPVCVTDESHIDAAIEMLNKYDVILATFGDMMRVQGTYESLLDQSHKRKTMVVLYSPLDAIELAKKNVDKVVIFFAVGFETTAPLIALAVKIAYEQSLDNIYFLTSLKLMPPILHKILMQRDKIIHGIICPGHVAAVKGEEYFKFITQDYGIPAAVCGFDGLDIAAGLYYLIEQHKHGNGAGFKNLYKTCVSENGNIAANQILEEVFEIGEVVWRGIGQVKDSALILNAKYSSYDALKKYNINLNSQPSKHQCNCSDVILGNILPRGCSLFGNLCNPQNPKGPCMVSGEGACSIYYRYGDGV
ncbi:MAG: hydrogenase formation protein HypD [Clostridiales bacterium]|nr:hydrogenase formation protein HypD [Clostridiales bacterium]